MVLYKDSGILDKILDIDGIKEQVYLRYLLVSDDLFLMCCFSLVDTQGIRTPVETRTLVRPVQATMGPSPLSPLLVSCLLLS